MSDSARHPQLHQSVPCLTLLPSCTFLLVWDCGLSSKFHIPVVSTHWGFLTHLASKTHTQTRKNLCPRRECGRGLEIFWEYSGVTHANLYVTFYCPRSIRRH